jgi:hypothetical protein
MPEATYGITVEELREISIYIDNDLDEDVEVQIKVNRTSSTTKAAKLSSSFIVGAYSSEIRTLTPEISGWLPYIYLELKCSTSPTEGSVTAYRIRSKNDQVVMVDSLEIRDTLLHTPDSDPLKVRIVEW